MCVIKADTWLYKFFAKLLLHSNSKSLYCLSCWDGIIKKHCI